MKEISELDRTGNAVPHFPDVTTFVVTEANLACS